MRTLFVRLCALLLRIYFRRIEVVGRHRLPGYGAVVFALNHPNGLLDPLFVLCLSGCRVSFLAKAPLFKMPFVGFFVRVFESLPVYRSRDGADPAQNRAMMQHAVDLLARGNAIALFPEGTSHSAPQLKKLKTGAARIALSARALGDLPVSIVPAALYYEDKQVFRSRAVLAFGAPLEVPATALDETSSPDRHATLGLTQALQTSLDRLMPTAQTQEQLLLAEQAERLLSSAVLEAPEVCPSAVALCQALDESNGAERRAGLTLGQRMLRRRRLIDAYQRLLDTSSAEVDDVVREVRELVDELQGSGLSVDATTAARRRSWLVPAGLFALGSPLWLVGAALHAPAYQLVRWFGFRFSSGEADVTSTVKLLAGLLLFPLSWVLFATGCGLWMSPAAGWSALAMAPLLAWVTIVLQEALERARFLRKRRLRSEKRSPMQIREQRARLAERIARLMTVADSLEAPPRPPS